MRKVLLTVASGRNIPNTIVLMKSAESYLGGWDKIVYIIDLDMNVLCVSNSITFENASYRSAECLFGDDFKDNAFYFLEKEFSEYVKIKAVKSILKDYDCILLVDCEGVFYSPPVIIENILNSENVVAEISQNSFFNYDSIPESFLFFNKVKTNSKLFGISKGAGTEKFINWCEMKFEYIIEHQATTVVDNQHTAAEPNEQSDFMFSWQRYASVFNLKSYQVNEAECLALRTAGEISDHVRIHLFVSFSQMDKSEKITDSHVLNALKEKYFNEIEEILHQHGVINHYKFDYFSDGNTIHKLLRPYYNENFRLRDLCKNNPFECRSAFTDVSVITGDETSVPVSAIAECIWKNRPDLQSRFPDYRDSDRLGYVRWFLKHATEEYGLPDPYKSALSLKYIEQMEKIDKSGSNLLLVKCINNVVGKWTKLLEIVGRKHIDKYPPGINLCCFIRGEFGLGEAARILARTFSSGNIPFTIVNYEPKSNHKYINHEWDKKISNEFKYNTNIMVISADGTPDFFKSISGEAIKNRYNIGFWYWELPEFPDRWSERFDYYDEIWTASEFMAEAFRRKTALPVFCLPCSIVVEYNQKMDREYFNLPENNFLFLMMYDVRSVQERKNPLIAVDAFLRAFGNRNDVALIIKVNMPDGWQLEDDMIEAVKIHDNIILYDTLISKVEVNSLIYCCDAFVSLHRSEGFGLGPAEAMYLGRPAILTNWSGNKEYMTDDNCCPVDYKIVELDKDYGPYGKGCHWAEPSVNHAAAYMQRLVEDKHYYETIAQNGKEHIKDKFSPTAICKIAENRLRQLKLSK